MMGEARNLDMLLDLDEPELFVREVHARVRDKMGLHEGRTDRHWGIVFARTRDMLLELEKANMPGAQVEGAAAKAPPDAA
jgi:hypothetical protein